jgi:hypothetical protein
MTWSLAASKLVGGQPIVRWNDTNLSALSADDFAAAVRSAEALGDDVVKQVEQNPRGGGVCMAGEADAVIMAVCREMDRRGELRVGKEGEAA